MSASPERALRSLYVYHRRRAEERLSGVPSHTGSNPIPAWDGGTDKHGRTFKPVWPKLARLIERHRCDPALFVESQFASSRYDHYPYPSHMLSDNALIDYRDHDLNGGDRAKAQLAAQKIQFLFETQRAQMLFDLDEDAAARQVLADSTVCLTPLFRYAMAVRGGADDVAEACRRAAVRQLTLRYHALSQGWGGFLPEEVADAAALKLAVLVEGGGS